MSMVEPIGTTEFLISFSIIIMMLSLVSERAANFVKLYFQGKYIYIPFVFKENGKWKFWIKTKLEILAYKQPTEMAEKEREYRVMIINVLIGIVIAAIANANLFELVKQIGDIDHENGVAIKGIFISGLEIYHFVGAGYLMFFLWSLSLVLFSQLQENESHVEKRYYTIPFLIWILFTLSVIVLIKFGPSDKIYFVTNGEIHFLSIIRHTAGYIFVGLFLSLGSKFWHDLLDVLFKLKNTQQVLSDPKTFTDYDNPDKLIALVETSQYEIAEKLFDLYKEDIRKIEGIVSYGLNTVLDERTRLYRKIIEVEFTTSGAQNELDKLQSKGSILLNYNTFYLKDFLKILYTKELIAISSIEEDKVCYAYNMDSKHNKGSFGVFEKEGIYYAKSNLHVFADPAEFKKFEDDPNYVLAKLKVSFVIDNVTFIGKGTITDYKFGNYNGEGIDYCVCTISKEIFDAYYLLIDQKKLLDIDNTRMSMFGAVSKFIQFHSFREGTFCNVDYTSFYKELYLFKIGVSTPGIDNISRGDSGSTIYYKIKIDNDKYKIVTGVIVAKSDNYAYMFRD